jgi:hypothetical protein
LISTRLWPNRFPACSPNLHANASARSCGDSQRALPQCWRVERCFPRSKSLIEYCLTDPNRYIRITYNTNICIRYSVNQRAVKHTLSSSVARRWPRETKERRQAFLSAGFCSLNNKKKRMKQMHPRREMRAPAADDSKSHRVPCPKQYTMTHPRFGWMRKIGKTSSPN